MTRTKSAVAAAAAVLLAGAALAAETSKQGSAGMAPGETKTKQKEGTYQEKNLRTVTIIVKEVDPKNHKVTFEATVKPEATNSSGEPIRLDQLKEGDTVRAAFDPKTGEVVRVDVTKGQGKQKAVTPSASRRLRGRPPPPRRLPRRETRRAASRTFGASLFPLRHASTYSWAASS
jgi:Cu/Ag efflux protein CusF